MRYEEFRDRLRDALCEVRLISRNLSHPIETIELSNTERRWQLYLWQPAPQNVDPFQVSAKVAFDWTPIDSARSYTCEEDLVADLLGKKQQSVKTEDRLVRVDLVLHATLPYGSTTPLPDVLTLGSWTNAIGDKLDTLITEIKGRKGRITSVLGGREEVKIEVRCDATGLLSLDGLSVATFRIVRVPRIWDDPERRQSEKVIGDQLTKLSERFGEAIEEWTKGVAELSRWIRYAPPPPDLEEMEEPEFEEEVEEEDDNDSETIH
jgi:hypothetical protein